ncbi:MAG: hypothetical protein RL885_12760 [Planctomycetota bacterium]
MRKSRRVDPQSLLIDSNQWLIFFVTLAAAVVIEFTGLVPFRYLAIAIVIEIAIIGVILPLRRAKRIQEQQEQQRRERFEQYRAEIQERSSSEVSNPAD